MKETWDQTIKASAEICARAEDLIAYLYGEANGAEARDFEKHMERCGTCRTELSAFGNVREAVGEWRQQALGTLRSPAFETEAAKISASQSAASMKRRSAFVAIREFFALSPAWLRAATTVAALVFCALSAIAVAYFVQQPQTVVIERPIKVEDPNKEPQPLTATTGDKPGSQRVDEKPAPSPRNSEAPVNGPQRVRTRATQNSSQMARNNVRHQPSTRKLSGPSTELVRADDYLPFTASREEEKLPSLSDLVSEDN